MSPLRYLPHLEINATYANVYCDNCAVISRTADGKRMGACAYPLEGGTTCPVHGVVKADPRPQPRTPDGPVTEAQAASVNHEDNVAELIAAHAAAWEHFETLDSRIVGDEVLSLYRQTFSPAPGDIFARTEAAAEQRIAEIRAACPAVSDFVILTLLRIARQMRQLSEKHESPAQQN